MYVLKLDSYGGVVSDVFYDVNFDICFISGVNVYCRIEVKSSKWKYFG